jgi:rSAM/selenodomain-associated transferase 2
VIAGADKLLEAWALTWLPDWAVSLYLSKKSMLFMNVSIIIPMRNEAQVLPDLLAHLLDYARKPGVEVIFVDGGSTDASLQMVKLAGFDVISSAQGRAVQMNAGAAYAKGDLLLFVHADSRLPAIDPGKIGEQLKQRHRVWGRFDVEIIGRSGSLPLVSVPMNLRSRLTGIATGDQGIFVTREAFDRVGGFPEQPLMEDIELCKRLLRLSRPLCLRERMITSGRRWDERGVWPTILLMWRLRWAYWRGADPVQLSERYR